MQLALYNLRHNIKLAYNNVSRVVIVFITSDIAFAPSSPMELFSRLWMEIQQMLHHHTDLASHWSISLHSNMYVQVPIL